MCVVVSAQHSSLEEWICFLSEFIKQRDGDKKRTTKEIRRESVSDLHRQIMYVSLRWTPYKVRYVNFNL